MPPTDNVLAGVLTFKKGLEVVVVALTAGVVKNLTGTGNGIVPIATDGLFAVSKPEWLRTDGL